MYQMVKLSSKILKKEQEYFDNFEKNIEILKEINEMKKQLNKLNKGEN